MLREIIAQLARGEDLSAANAAAAMREIMSGDAPEALIGGFLVGLKAKGETAEEIAACAEVLREQGTKIVTRRRNVVDTCGTGGDGAGTFNISTTAAIIASAAGVSIAKHGNRSVSSACGSADVLSALGVKVDVDHKTAGAILDDIGITFLYAPLLHSAMRNVAKARKDLGIRTVFNILGPLANPAGCKRQVLGVYEGSLGLKMAKALLHLGTEHALVVHGHDGLDELTTGAKTSVWEVKRGKIQSFLVDSSDFGIPMTAKNSLFGGNAEVNAEVTRSILEGKNGAPKDVAVLNAAAAIVVSGMAASLEAGLELAREAVDSGRGLKKLKDWIDATNA